MNRLAKLGISLVCLAAIGMWICDDTLAQRGRAGAGGGGGGGARGGSVNRGGASMNRGGSSMQRPSSGRTPGFGSSSMSRPLPGGQRPTGGGLQMPSTGAQRPGVGQQPSLGQRPGGVQGTRPTSRDVQHFLDVNPRPGTASRPASGGGAAADFLNNPGARPGAAQRPAVQPGLADRPVTGDRVRPNTGTNLANNRPDRIEDRQQWRTDRIDRRKEIINDFHAHPAHLPHYGPDWWHGRNWHWHWNNYRYNWWGWATWGSVVGWLPYQWSQPVYYNYGDNCYYENNTVYYDGQPVASADEYAQQAQAIATNIPQVDAEQMEWMPLGVFALTQDGQASGPDPTMFLQLAISKDGIIAGTFQNTATDKVVEVEGTIDKDSQRVAWGPVGESWPIMETGVYNLTEDQASALVHFADGQTQQWLMVRLDEPAANGDTR